MLIGAGTVALMAALWYLLVVPMQVALRKTEAAYSKHQDNLAKAQRTMRSATDIGETFSNKVELLQQRESGLAPARDTYAWIINTINPFIQSRKGVNIVSFSEPVISDEGLLPRFSYKWATCHVSAIGYYQDFGKFFADFENSFPYFRIQNVDVSVNTGPAAEAEKLSFNFDIVTPVVPNSEPK